MAEAEARAAHTSTANITNIAEEQEKRLWIGNLDQRVNEYQLLKLTQKFGKIAKFDLLYHRNGPHANKPRGYAFVTYEKKSDALKAKNRLSGQQLGDKRITVTWAHCIPIQEIDAKKPIEVPALTMTTTKSAWSREKQIKAIEAKLNMMSHNSRSDLIINKTVATEAPVVPKSNIRENLKPTTKYRAAGSVPHRGKRK